MNQQEEQSWERVRQRDLEEKKMYALHSQNQRLRSQQELSEIAIHDYIRKVDLFNSKSLTLQEENQKLKAEVQSLNAANRKIEGLLDKRSQEYCSLYNYLFTEKRGSMQDLFVKEIDLNNRLSEIQHESDSQIIEKLKATIKSKNQDLLRLAQRNNELGQALATSSFDYQQQINALKHEKLKLQEELSISKLEPQKTNAGDYFTNKKIEALKKQISLYKQEVLACNNELNYLKNLSSQLEKTNVLQQNELQEIKSRQPLLTGDIIQLIHENKYLSEQVENLRSRYELLVTSLPVIQEKVHAFIDLQQKIGEQRKEVNKLKSQMVIKNKQIAFVSDENAKLKQQNGALSSKYADLEIVSTSCFIKLKKLIEGYIPYYLRKDGFEQYSLTEEEANFLAQRNVQSTLMKMKKDVAKTISQNSKLKIHNSSLEKASLLQLERIRQLQKESAERETLINKLEESTKSLLEKCNHLSQNQPQLQSYGHYNRQEGSHSGYHMQNEENSSNFAPENGASQEQESPQRNHQYAPNYQYDNNEILYYETQPVEQVSEKKRIQVLQLAIEEMQSDRNELINIIRNKDIDLIKLNAQIKVLRTFNQTNTNNIYQSSFPSLSLQQATLIPKPQQGEIQEIKSELRQLSDSYRMDKELIVKQYEDRECELRSKYLSLLKSYDQLLLKYNTLEVARKSQQIVQQSQSRFHADVVNEAEESALIQGNEIMPEGGQGQSIISQTAIQNFTEVLKKYEKQFQKYVNIYEKQIKKSLESSNEQVVLEEVNSSQQHVHQLEQVIKQHQETIKNLEDTVSEKEQYCLSKVGQLQDELAVYKHSANQLNLRLEQQYRLLSDLNEQVLLQKASLQFASAESANSTFSALHIKNKQIQTLKQANQKLKQSYLDACREAAKLKDLSTPQSQAQSEEYRHLKEIIEKEDLLGVLEGAIRLLQ